MLSILISFESLTNQGEDPQLIELYKVNSWGNKDPIIYEKTIFDVLGEQNELIIDINCYFTLCYKLVKYGCYSLKSIESIYTKANSFFKIINEKRQISTLTLIAINKVIKVLEIINCDFETFLVFSILRAFKKNYNR